MASPLLELIGVTAKVEPGQYLFDGINLSVEEGPLEPFSLELRGMGGLTFSLVD